MPIYEYKRPDGTTFELHQAFSEDPLTTDPESGVAVERVLHAPAVHFKGKGFYNTDYGTRKRQRENAASADSSSSGSGESSSSESSSESAKKEDSAGKGTREGTGETKKSESPSKPEKKTDSKPVAAAK